MARDNSRIYPSGDHSDDEDDDFDYLEEDDACPIEQVRLTVPTTDDPTLPALTFRTWVLGLTSCCLLSFVNQFFSYRQNHLYISSISVQIVVLPLGKLMAATLPERPINVPFSGWSFSMNPGPFNLKEHVLITIFANSGASGVYAVHIITSVKAFYRRDIHPLAGFLLSQTTQGDPGAFPLEPNLFPVGPAQPDKILGYGWAGLFRKYLVDSPYMWWPSNLVQVALFRALHEKEKRPRGGHTRLQFFVLVFVSSFVYYIIPAYLFPMISTISAACLIWRNSVTAQQIGSGIHGLGIGSFGFDWSTVAGFLGSPLASPAFAIINTIVGFVLVIYVALPILYWGNAYDARKFPIISSHTFDSSGHIYNISRILVHEKFDIDRVAYEGYSKLYLSVFFALIYGLSFATLTATLSHVALFHGGTIWKMWKKTGEVLKSQMGDVHTRLMKQNYDEVPQWWFHVILVSMVGLALWACEGFDRQLQLPWWGVLLACTIALIFTLPIGIIAATTNMQPGLNVITELVIGYLYPGKPLANVAFKTYGYISMSQALTLVKDLKLGHYMKIPPKSMFIVQLVGTVVATTVYFCTAWWLLTTVDHICDPTMLPEGSPWTCPLDDVFYNASIIWGVVGPRRMFTNLGIYPEMNWFFLIGLLSPVPIWALTKKFPEKTWLTYINLPIIFGATQMMPPARSVNYISWGTVGLFFNLYIFKKFKLWWARHNYILSAGLDVGIAFLAVVLYFTLHSRDIFGPDWWGLAAIDHCPLATCPTAPGVKLRGCPVN